MERARGPSAVAAPGEHDYQLTLTVPRKHKQLLKHHFQEFEFDESQIHSRSSRRLPLTQKPSHCTEQLVS